MEPITKMGKNRTGVQMSPMDMERLLKDIDEKGTVTGKGDGAAIAAVRTTYITEAEPVGTVPPPGTVTGAMKTAVKKLTGTRPEVLIDKLGERLAFERTGVRLYDALLTKYQAMPEKLADMSVDELAHIRDEEALHFRMVADALASVGADPTSQTPSADIIGVESAGLMQVIDDPRTTLAQCLNAVLVAELADNAGWELLGTLAEEAGLEDMAETFAEALATEQQHLAKIKEWHQQCVLTEMT